MAASVRKGTRVRHVDHPDHLGVVLRLMQRWDSDYGRWEPMAEVDWGTVFFPSYQRVYDLVVVRRERVR